MFIAIELCLTAICLALAYIRPQLGDAFFSRLEHALSVFAHRHRLVAVSVGLLALAVVRAGRRRRAAIRENVNDSLCLGWKVG